MSTAELLPTLDHQPIVLSDDSPPNGAPVRGTPTDRRIGPPRPGREADQSPALLEEFAATVAHELRTPLAVVGLAADTVLDRKDELSPEQVAEMLRVIQRSTRLATLVLGRLEMARGVGVGNIHLERELIDLATVASEIRSDLAEVLLKWHPTEVHAPAAVMVRADPTAVREILSNLLSNAVKYSPQGSYIDVSVVQREDRAQITVRDRGCGLTAGDAERVFEKYQQADADRGGVGLGLYVSRGLARAHGGDLEVRPAPARGSEFRLTLPIAVAS